MERQAAMCVIARMLRFGIAVRLLPAVLVLVAVTSGTVRQSATVLLRHRAVRQAAMAAVVAVLQAVRWEVSVVAAVGHQVVRWAVRPHVAAASVVEAVVAAVADKRHRERKELGLIK